jgi:hypothetical protein
MKSLDSVNYLCTDGFLAHTFSPQDARHFLTVLLRTSDFMQYYRISYAQGVWYIMRDPFPPSSGVQKLGLLQPLDFSVKLNPGTVIPQRRWTPADNVDVRRHVSEATLQFPIFFVKRNGGVGFRLPDVLQGNDHDLCNRDSKASLGGVTTTHIRINVSPRTLISIAAFFVYVLHLLSQWPGYGHWKRQIPARDETYYRNPITLGRFMKHVGTSIDKFFNVSSSLLL